MNRIYVSNISWNATENDIETLFQKCGTVKSVKFINDRETGRFRGFGFVEMETAEEAQLAIKQLSETDFMGRNLNVKPAEQRKPQGGNRPRN